MTVSSLLVLTFAMVVIAWVGLILNQRNVIVMLLSLELMFLASGINFVGFSNFYQHLDGQVMVLFMLGLAACESAVALALFVLMYRQRQTVSAVSMNQLRG